MVELKPVHRVVLTKMPTDATYHGAKPGEWKPAKLPDGTPSAVVGCADCGTWAALMDHTVDENGVVRPSIGCPSCGWHVFATLKDWKTNGVQ